MPRPSRRAELLDAAIAVIRRDGAQRLTLDAVAEQARVSKGGVLYHFGSKRALIEGLLDRWLEDREARLDGRDFTAAYVSACDPSGSDPRAEFGLLAALFEAPDVLEAARDRHGEWMARILAGVADPTDAWMVRLAADGLWYSDLLGLAPPQGEDRRRLIARLLALAAGGNR